ncbi:MAG: hypothetical protein ABR607_00030 [Pyrinomonadaceae bacterium]
MRIDAIVVFIVILACGSSSFTQSTNQRQSDRLGFSGSWVLDETKNKLIKQGRTRIVTGLEIVIREPEIKIKETVRDNGTERTEEFLFFSDGRGELNKLPALARSKEKEEVKSHTKWEKDRLVINYSLRWQLASDTMYFDVQETWQLAGGGNVLVHTKKLGNPQSAFHKTRVLPEVMETTTWVYNRAPVQVSN